MTYYEIILGVLLIGVLLALRQVIQLFSEVRWVNAYNIGRADAQVALSVHDAAGTLVTTLEPLRTRGVNRVVWKKY